MGSKVWMLSVDVTRDKSCFEAACLGQARAPRFHSHNVTCYSVSEKLNKLLNYVIEYETPKVVTVHNVSIGLIR